MRSLRNLLPTLVGVWLLARPGVAAPPDAESVKFFESRVRPLLIDHCFGCHGPEKQKGGLRLDSAAGLAAGGAQGTPLAGANGLLLRAVRHDADAPKMPPKGKLTDRQIDDLSKWVAMGAPYPPPVKSAAGNAPHWAFVPPVAPKLPESATIHPIDQFVNAKLRAAGLKLSPPADKRTLLRRVTFDLTGLPPTPEEMAAFLADESPSAYPDVIRRLLASPAYGEKWGRHWLDVARYADSNGLDENIAHGNAWRYRDYVIAAFNDDKRFDVFLHEQIAGDLIRKDEGERMKDESKPGSSHSSFILHPSSFSPKTSSFDPLIATGFLSIGPKVLAEADKRKMELDIVDEQIDTLGRAVMGLTVGCARCHDHKFDPLALTDYYGLAGVFLSTKTMESLKTIARWHENPIGTQDDVMRQAEFDAERARAEELVKSFTGKDDEESKFALVAVKDRLADLDANPVVAPSAMGVTEAKPVEAPLLRRGDHTKPGEPVHRGFPTVLGGPTTIPASHSGRLELARWLTRPDHPLTARVIVNRVWRWHFGRGLVASVDNFGRLGDKPSHPELLDWLAVQFVRDGWSIKRLHELILTSAAYRSASTYSETAAVIDPDDRLLWRFPPRRLQAEEIRDSLLAVSDRLDRTRGGPSLTHVKNREFLFDHTSIDKTRYDSTRRTVYLPVIRNNLYDVFQLFDAPDAAVSNGDRATTTVATQSLFWLNAELVTASADALAGKLMAEGDPVRRVERLHEIVYGRMATTDEVNRTLAAVGGFEKSVPSRKAWAMVCQVALAANEFVTVR